MLLVKESNEPTAHSSLSQAKYAMEIWPDFIFALWGTVVSLASQGL